MGRSGIALLRRWRASSTTVPTHPWRLRRWLRELPLLNPGETTRLFFNGLERLNRTPLPPARRLRLMETLAPTAEILLDELHRQLGARGLPLPNRSRKALHLSQALLRQLAAGYALCAAAPEAGRRRLRRGAAALALQRALQALRRALLESAEVYAPDPAGLWAEAHRLYAQAQRLEVAAIPVRSLKAAGPRTSPQEVYKTLCLLAISSPQSLRQSEALRLARYFEANSAACDLTSSPVADAAGGVYLVDLSADEPPFYALLSEITPGPEMRALNLSTLSRRLRALQAQEARDGTGAVLDPALARRVLANWNSTGAKRRFSRVRRELRVPVALGMRAVLAAVRGDPPPDSIAPQAEAVSPPRPRRPEPPPPDPASVWETVARGNLIGDTSQTAPPLELEPLPEPVAPPPRWPMWWMHDASPGGCSLRWRGDTPSRAQVGELVAVGPPHGSAAPWKIGVIRWMQSSDGYGSVQLGVELLAQQGRPVEIHPPGGEPLGAVLIPAAQQPDESVNLLVAGGALKGGEELQLQDAGELQRIRLGAAVERNADFALFRYAPT